MVTLGANDNHEEAPTRRASGLLILCAPRGQAPATSVTRPQVAIWRTSWFCHIHDPGHLLAGEQKDCDQEVFSHSPGSVSTDDQGIIDVAHAFSSQELQLLAPCLPECCIG